VSLGATRRRAFGVARFSCSSAATARSGLGPVVGRLASQLRSADRVLSASRHRAAGHRLAACALPRAPALGVRLHRRLALSRLDGLHRLGLHRRRSRSRGRRLRRCNRAISVQRRLVTLLH
jgi:hypothetical protein